MTRESEQKGSVIALDDRAILRVAGPDAVPFLQGLVTQDVERVFGEGKLLYSALLTPQGNLLHDFFLFGHGEEILLDCEHARRNDLLHRLGLYRLRAKVSIEDVSSLWRVYASLGEDMFSDTIQVFEDPRYSGMTYRRVYAEADDELDAQSSPAYNDACIVAGLPLGARTFMPERDIAADMNMDLLHAIAWDKGCYVGQEVTARVRFRGLVKKRLLIARGGAFSTGDRLLQGGGEIGEIRTVSSDGSAALAVARISALENKEVAITDMQGRLVRLCKPDYLP